MTTKPTPTARQIWRNSGSARQVRKRVEDSHGRTKRTLFVGLLAAVHELGAVLHELLRIFNRILYRVAHLAELRERLE